MIREEEMLEELRQDFESFKARVEELKTELESINKEIKKLEKKYGISSKDFLSGKIPPEITEEDREEWRGLLFYRDTLKKAVKELSKAVEKDQKVLDSLLK